MKFSRRKVLTAAAAAGTASLPLAPHLARAQVGNNGRRVRWIAHQPGDVAHKNQPLGPQGHGRLGGRGIGIAIVKLAITPPRGGTDHRDDVFAQTILERSDIDLPHFPNVARILASPLVR